MDASDQVARRGLLPAGEPGALEAAAALLRAGGLVAFPTDTLYGLGASLAHPAAIARLYRVKQRPADKAIPVLLAEAAGLSLVAAAVPAGARRLMARFWPGPLTLVLPKRADLPAVLSPNRGVAVRVPDHDLARRLLAAAGGAVATTSANLSGRPAATSAGQVLAALGPQVAAVLDGGPVRIGQASTVVDFTAGRPRILRTGPLSAEELDL
ncbi:MAG: L-threonylcarbamoyladenylate synthase [Candidatus Promineifilaceae bacterium]